MLQIQTFGLVLMRVASLFLVAPVLGNARIPNQIKIGIVLTISLLLVLAGPQIENRALYGNIFDLLGAIAGEFFVGLVIGYAAYLLFTGIQMAGQIVDIQTGFGLVNVVDPTSNTQVSILGQFYQLIALLFFLAINGHHVLIQAVGDSFKLVSAGGFAWLTQTSFAGPLLSDFFSRLFIIAFQIAAPSIATLFLVNLTMGLLSRTIPQMNVFIVGLPLNIMIGIGFTFLSLKLLGSVLNEVIGKMSESISQLLRAMVA